MPRVTRPRRGATSTCSWSPSRCRLAGMGLLLIYSATQHKENVGDISATGYLKRQALWVAIGVVAMVVTAVVDYRVLRDLSPVLYVGTVLVLVAVLSPLGTNSRGRAGVVPVRFLPAAAVRVRQARLHPLPGRVLRGPSGRPRLPPPGDGAGGGIDPGRADLPAARPRHRPRVHRHPHGHAARRRRPAPPHRRAHAARDHRRGGGVPARCAEGVPDRPAGRVPRPQGRHPALDVQPQPVGERRSPRAASPGRAC